MSRPLGTNCPHGTHSRYNYGCRCKRCRAAVAEYQRAHRARRRLAAEGYAWADSITNTTEPLHDGGVSSTRWDIRLNQERRGVPIGVITTHAPIVADSVITATQTAPGAWTYQVRTPLEQLVDACVDLREAFADYYAAREEPVT